MFSAAQDRAWTTATFAVAKVVSIGAAHLALIVATVVVAVTEAKGRPLQS
jgi:hypothetical protein